MRLLDIHVCNQTVEETQLIAFYELERLHETLSTSKEFANSELADFITMITLLCEQLGNDIYEFMTVGLEEGSCSLDEVQIAYGRLVRSLIYQKRFGTPRGPSTEDCLRKLLDKTRLFSRRQKVDFWEVQELGVERFKERMQDLRTEGLKGQLKET